MAGKLDKLLKTNNAAIIDGISPTFVDECFEEGMDYQSFHNEINSAEMKAPTMAQLKEALSMPSNEDATNEAIEALSSKDQPDNGRKEIQNIALNGTMDSFYNKSETVKYLKEHYPDDEKVRNFAGARDDRSMFCENYIDPSRDRSEQIRQNAEKTKHYIDLLYSDNVEDRKQAYKERTAELIERYNQNRDLLKPNLTDREIAQNANKIMTFCSNAVITSNNSVMKNLDEETFQKWDKFVKQEGDTYVAAKRRLDVILCPAYKTVSPENMFSKLNSEQLMECGMSATEAGRYANGINMMVGSAAASNINEIYRDFGYNERYHVFGTDEEHKDPLKFYDKNGVEFPNETKRNEAFALMDYPIYAVDITQKPVEIHAVEKGEGLGYKVNNAPSEEMRNVMDSIYRNNSPEARMETDVEVPVYKQKTDVNFTRLAFLSVLDRECPEYNGMNHEIVRTHDAKRKDGRVPQTDITSRVFGSGRVINPVTMKAFKPEEANKAAIMAFTGDPAPLFIDRNGNLQKISLNKTRDNFNGVAEKLQQFKKGGYIDLSQASSFYKLEKMELEPRRIGQVYDMRINAIADSLRKTESRFSNDSDEFKAMRQALKDYREYSEFISGKASGERKEQLKEKFRGAPQEVEKRLVTNLQRTAENYQAHVGGAGKNSRQQQRSALARELYVTASTITRKEIHISQPKSAPRKKVQ